MGAYRTFPHCPPLGVLDTFCPRQDQRLRSSQEPNGILHNCKNVRLYNPSMRFGLYMLATYKWFGGRRQTFECRGGSSNEAKEKQAKD